MNIDTTIYGYVLDGAVVCPDCHTDDDPDDSPVLGYNLGAWADPEGLSCDRCGEYIVEPIQVEVSENLLEPIEEPEEEQAFQKPWHGWGCECPSCVSD